MIAPSPFALAAPAILANGYRPIPIMPGDKVPGETSYGRWRPSPGWPRWRDEVPGDFQVRIWKKYDDAGIGIVLGQSVATPDGPMELIALDFDTDDQDLLDKIESAVVRSPVQKRGRRGYTGFYLAPKSTPGRKFKRDADVIFEVLTGNNTRQTILPPSIHPLTKAPYVWLTKATLENTLPADLPVLDQDALDRLMDTLETMENVSESRAPARAAYDPDAEETPHRALNNAALANLDAWVPALPLHGMKRTSGGFRCVATWRGATNPNVGIKPDGIRDFGSDEGITPLSLAMVVNGWDLEDAFSWLSSRLGMVDEGFGEELIDAEPSAEVVPLAVRQPEPAALPPHDAETGEILADTKLAVVQQIAEELPDDLTRVPGLLGDVVDWIVDTDRQPNRVLALGAAVVVLGTLVGRHYAGPTYSGTHLYIVALAPTGAGKDHSLSSIGPLLKAANASGMVGPSDFMSMSAVNNTLVRMPQCVCAMDEFGAYIRRVTHKRASTHEQGMSKVLREAWGKSFREMQTPEFAQVLSKTIQSPAMSIYGASTPDEFFQALQSQEAVNGFLNRLLVLQTAVIAGSVDPKLGRAVPPELAAALAALRMQAANAVRHAPIAAGQRDISGLIAPPEPAVLDWGPGAKGEYSHMLLEVAPMRQDPTTGAFWGRTCEMAVRLATIRAVGHTGVVSLADMQWGRAVATWSSQRMIEAADEHMAENPFQELQNRIIRFMRKKQCPVTRRDIQTHLKSSLKVKELSDHLEAMCEGGRIVMMPRDEPKVGRPSSPFYRLPRAAVG